MPLPVYEVPAIPINTTKSTYTFTSVKKARGNQTGINTVLRKSSVLRSWIQKNLLEQIW